MSSELNSYFRKTKGRYLVGKNHVEIDFSLLDAVIAKSVVVHEMCHSLLSNTSDYGQACFAIENLLPQYSHLSKSEKKQITEGLIREELFVQEGTATFMQICHIGEQRGEQNALDWADSALPDDPYKSYFNILKPIFRMTNDCRDILTSKIAPFALETGIRKDMYEQDLLSSNDKLLAYLADEKNNPDARFRKLVEALKKSPTLFNHMDKLLEQTGVEIYSLTKDEVAHFANYVHVLAGNTTNIQPEDVQDKPPEIETLKRQVDSLVITSFGRDLEGSAEPIFKTADIQHYKKVVDLIAGIKLPETDKQDWLIPLIEHKPETTLLFTRPTKEKYMFVTSIANAESLLKEDFGRASFVVGLDQFELTDGKLGWSRSFREPDILIVHSGAELEEVTKKILSNGKNFESLIVVPDHGHLFHTLIVKLPTVDGLMIYTEFGNRNIAKFRRTTNAFRETMRSSTVEASQDHIDRFLIFWGLPDTENWAETISAGLREKESN